MSRKSKKIKWLLIAEIIVFYMSLLNLLSHVRALAPYRVITEDVLLTAEDFQSFRSPEVFGTNGVLSFGNETDGEVEGYQCQLVLSDLGGLSVCFEIDCPAAYAGNVLTVDLFNAQAGYDSSEQEEQTSLLAGWNTVEIALAPGENAPDTAQLRIFTTQPAQYEVRDLQVYGHDLLPKVTPSMVGFTIAMGALLCGTIFVDIRNKRGESP